MLNRKQKQIPMYQLPHQKVHQTPKFYSYREELSILQKYFLYFDFISYVWMVFQEFLPTCNLTNRIGTPHECLFCFEILNFYFCAFVYKVIKFFITKLHAIKYILGKLFYRKYNMLW